MSDDLKFSDTLKLVLGLLVVLALVIYYVSQAIIEETQNAFVKEDSAYQEQLNKRIAPVGRVAIAGQSDEVEAREPEPEPAAAAMSGEDIYNSSCVACHGIGIAGAPKVGDTEAWAPRIDQGLPTLYEHAIDGYQGNTGMMPPKGGAMSLSDDEIKAAVDYMARMYR
ncbi:MAG: cytochrome c5 family protein [Gammaproteobacteria bacterium]|nr:cytochrome c5 family protein [Gammaproteobacteria bacterium]MCZ6826630.1 cytochrome c5 family protein [Gammaproteobacteria bacterium]